MMIIIFKNSVDIKRERERDGIDLILLRRNL